MYNSRQTHFKYLVDGLWVNRINEQTDKNRLPLIQAMNILILALSIQVEFLYFFYDKKYRAGRRNKPWHILFK